MLKLLILIKHKCRFIWDIIETCNSYIFQIIYGKKMRITADEICKNIKIRSYQYRLLNSHDIDMLHHFFISQPDSTYEYFKPHDFDKKTLSTLNKRFSFYMFGVFDGNKLIGYSLLRFFVNKQAFAGFLVDSDYQGQGIAKVMGRTMFKICWDNGFRVFATVSQHNSRALASYRAINNFRIIKNLPNDYIYIEYMKLESTEF